MTEMRYQPYTFSAPVCPLRHSRFVTAGLAAWGTWLLTTLAIWAVLAVGAGVARLIEEPGIAFQLLGTAVGAVALRLVVRLAERAGRRRPDSQVPAVAAISAAAMAFWTIVTVDRFTADDGWTTVAVLSVVALTSAGKTRLWRRPPPITGSNA